MKKILFSLTMAGLVVNAGMAYARKTSPILKTYATIAEMSYADALSDAKKLKTAIHAFTKNPTEKTYAMAKKAWLNSRETYGQTEAFRFSNGPIDAEDSWVSAAYGANIEEQINAWPLDEVMIDYTVDASGKRTSGNIIDTVGSFTPGGEDAKPVNMTKITATDLTSLNMNGGEANVTTGYHAIEFLLWGQDQDYANFLKDNITHGAMVAGQRPLTDYSTDKWAPRRKAYLNASIDKLIADLQVVSDAWAYKVDGNKGLYRVAFLGHAKDKRKNIDEKTAIKQITTGMGIFIKSELANERIAVAALTPSEEDEHSCFSDNTHRDIAQNYQGFKNILLGKYEGKKIGTSLFDKASPAEKKRIMKLIQSIDKKVATINKTAQESAHFDYQIRPDSPHLKTIISMKNEMRKLGDQMVSVAKSNGVSLTAKDVTDPEETKL